MKFNTWVQLRESSSPISQALKKLLNNVNFVRRAQPKLFGQYDIDQLIKKPRSEWPPMGQDRLAKDDDLVQVAREFQLNPDELAKYVFGIISRESSGVVPQIDMPGQTNQQDVDKLNHWTAPSFGMPNSTESRPFSPSRATDADALKRWRGSNK